MTSASFASHTFLRKFVYLCNLCNWAVDPLAVHWTRYKNRICEGTSQTRSELEKSFSYTLVEKYSKGKVKSVLSLPREKHFKMHMLRFAMGSHAKVDQRSNLVPRAF